MLHVQKLQIENTADSVQQVLADRSINPSDGDVQREFRAWRVRNYGKDNGREMFDKLDELVERYNNENEEKGGKSFLQWYVSGNIDKTTTEKPLVLAIVTPLMARTHMHIPL